MNFEPTVIHSTPDEISLLSRLTSQKNYLRFSEMVDQDRNFLNSLILRLKPQKIVEIGVAKGGSSGIILNAIKDIKNAHLFSVDLNKNCYSMPEKATGFLMDEFPDLKKKWTLLTGGTIYDFADTIGGGVDLALIDTVHTNPGEILDFLGIFPYLKKDAVVIFHDTNLQAVSCQSKCSTNNTLMSAIAGEKLVPDNSPFSGMDGFLNNIGAIKLNVDTFKSIYSVFNLLALHWEYLPTQDQFVKMISFFKKHYKGGGELLSPIF